jgi:hypothetical protein
MPKNKKSIKKSPSAAIKREEKAKNDFFFFLVVSVFAALTLLTANFLAQSRQEAIQASQAQQQPIDLAPLDIDTP